MGVYLETVSQLCYSVSEDKRFKVLDINKNSIISDLAVGSEKHTGIIGDKDNKRVFISNRGGQVFIYDIAQKEPKIIHTIQVHTSKSATIRGLYFDHYKNYLFTANYDDGVIGIQDLQKPGKEKYATNTANLQGKPKVRACVWSTNRYEIYTGNEDGTLTFWDVKKISPLCK
jgi:WD40 repeat protein